MTDEVSSPWLSFQHLDPFSQKGSGNVWNNPDSKVHATNMGPIWGRQDPGGPHVGPMNLAIRESNRGHSSPLKICFFKFLCPDNDTYN